MKIGPIHTAVSSNSEIAVINFAAPPINALSKDFLQSLQETIQQLESSDQIKAAILTSERPGVFCAGLDIFSLIDRQENELISFWSSFQNCFGTLFSTELVTVAAINGSSPAGGCMIATTCDKRVMVNNRKFKIGLNETNLGLVAPLNLIKAYERCVGPKQTEVDLVLGKLHEPQKALEIGLVDIIATDNKDCQKIAFEMAEEYLEVDDVARIGTKKLIRQEFMEWFNEYRKVDMRLFKEIISKEDIQKNLKVYAKVLRNRNK